MGDRVLDPLKAATWLALVLALALLIVAQHGTRMLPVMPGHSADHATHEQPKPDHTGCVLACIAFVEVVPAPIAVPVWLVSDLGVVPTAEILVGQDIEWASRPPWLAGY